MNSPLFQFLANKERRQNKRIHQLVKKSCSPTSTRGEFSVFSASLVYREWCSCNKWVRSEWRQQKRLAQKGENKPPPDATLLQGHKTQLGFFMARPCPDAHHHKTAGYRADACSTQLRMSIFTVISSIYPSIHWHIVRWNIAQPRQPDLLQHRKDFDGIFFDCWKKSYIHSTPNLKLLISISITIGISWFEKWGENVGHASWRWM